MRHSCQQWQEQYYCEGSSWYWTMEGTEILLLKEELKQQYNCLDICSSLKTWAIRRSHLLQHTCWKDCISCKRKGYF